MLSPYRVLDLTNERGLLCGQMLADLGADVIAVEPPEGNSARRLGPFADDEADPERSLYWWAYARNKRSITLDLTTAEGRDRLLELAADADFLIESDVPGRMAELGLGYDDLAAANPSLVYVSISAFGQDGPKAGYAESDLIVSAAGGTVAMAGDVDRAPIRMSVPQAYLHAGAEAAGAALIAHYERQRSGLGQHVDVSAQQAVTQAMQSFDLAASVGEQPLQRVTGGVMLGPILLPLVWEAKDGHVSITFLFGTLAPFAQRLMEWVHEDGFCDQATRDKDWVNYVALLMSGEESPEEYQRVLGTIAAFARSKTKNELLEAALDQRLLIAPINTIADLSGSEQFASRDFWREYTDAKSGREVRYPGPFALLGETLLDYRQPAPAIGEHNDDALTREQRPAAASRGNGSAGDGALEGLKVLDMMWVVAGPASTRVLADYGATVVRVESTGRPDTARGLQPFHNGEAGAEASALFGNMNAGKLGLTLDLTTEEGRAVVRDLVRWADVVTESFSPKAMRAWGLDYDSLKEINPKIIMLSSNLFGQTGPLSMFAGFGTMGAAIAGFNSVIGWPDRAPTMVAAYSDYVAPRFMVATVLAALDHHARSEQGQHIDLAQAEASMHFLTSALLDYEVNNRLQGGEANNDREMAPHGVYPAIGDERWVAIAIGTDAHWQALCEEMGQPELASDTRYATVAARLTAREELDAIVGAWTADQKMEAVEAALQARVVPAHAVQNSVEQVADPQLVHRGHFVELEHSVHGTTTVGGSHFRLSRTPARIERSAPTFGRDNFEVLSEILDYDADRIAELAAASVLQ
jgi:crotonobetainyl-CoA:carnitine CoA-transferase CaiB-like acyl-CoA transferase